MKNIKILTVVFLLTICVVFAQSYTYPTYQSGHDVAEWNMRGGHIASGSYSPSTTASEGALFYDISTPTTPLLYRYTDGAWAVAGGSGSGGGDTATITEAIEDNAAAIATNQANIETATTTMNAHIADQTDPHGATMTVSEGITVGGSTADAFIEYNGAGTVLISSYTQIPFESTEPTTISSDSVTLWAYTASSTLRAYDGDEWLELINNWISGGTDYIYYENRVLIATTTDRTESEELQVNGMAYIRDYAKMANSMAEIDMTENTTAQSIPTGTSWTTLDLANGHDHYEVGDVDADYANDKIVVNATGVYEVHLELSFYGDTSGVEWKFNALNAGVKSHCGCFQEIGSGWNAADKFSVACSAIVECATAPRDITVGVMHDDSGSVNLTAYRAMIRVKYLGEIQ